MRGRRIVVACHDLDTRFMFVHHMHVFVCLHHMHVFVCHCVCLVQSLCHHITVISPNACLCVSLCLSGLELSMHYVSGSGCMSFCLSGSGCHEFQVYFVCWIVLFSLAVM